MEDDFFFGVFPFQPGLQSLSGCNLISPQFVSITDSKAAHNFKTNIHCKISPFILFIPPIGIGKVMIKTPQRAQRPQDSLPRKV